MPILLPTFLAFAAAIGSVVVRDVPGDVAVFALRVLFQPLLFYFIGFLLPKTKRWVQWTVAVFLLSGVALALHGLFQYVDRRSHARQLGGRARDRHRHSGLLHHREPQRTGRLPAHRDPHLV